MMVPTHCAIRSNLCTAGRWHLKSWIVQTSADGEKRREIDPRENNRDLNRQRFTTTFAIAEAITCRFVRLARVGKNHAGNDCLGIATWEVSGRLLTLP
jgi:hypothetical protein